MKLFQTEKGRIKFKIRIMMRQKKFVLAVTLARKCYNPFCMPSAEQEEAKYLNTEEISIFQL